MDQPQKSISRGGDAETKARAARKGGLFVFGMFFLVGAGLIYALCLKPLRETIDSKSWPEAACRVISSEVGMHSGDNGPTYSIDIEYEYEVGGKRFRSKRYEVFGGSSSGYGSKRAVVDQYPPGREFACYYNPKDPSQALIRPGFTRMALVVLIPAAFALVGLIGMAAMLRGGKRAEAPGRFAETGGFEPAPRSERSSELVLEPMVSSSLKLGCALAGALVLTGILALIYLDELLSGRFSPWMLVNPLVWIDGVLVFVGLPYFYLATYNPRPVLTITPGEPRLGEDFTAAWRFSGSTGRLQRLTLSVTATETAQYRRGTRTITDRSVFHSQVVRELTMRPEFSAGSVTVRIPAESMHSWPLEESIAARGRRLVKEMGARAAQRKLAEIGRGDLHNKIVWELKLHGEIAMWPDVKESFEFLVYPAKVHGKEGS